MNFWKITNIWTNEQLFYKKLSHACIKINCNQGTIRNKLSKSNSSKTTYGDWKIEKEFLNL
jgi:hypothetical protein